MHQAPSCKGVWGMPFIAFLFLQYKKEVKIRTEKLNLPYQPEHVNFLFLPNEPRQDENVHLFE